MNQHEVVVSSSQAANSHIPGPWLPPIQLGPGKVNTHLSPGQHNKERKRACSGSRQGTVCPTEQGCQAEAASTQSTVTSLLCSRLHLLPLKVKAVAGT